MKFFHVIFISCLFLCCTKKETTIPDDNLVSTTAGSSVIDTNALSVFNGFFPLEQYKEWFNGVVVSSPILYNTKFTLFSNPVNENQQFAGLSSNLGVITVNSKQLQYYSPLKIYMDSTIGNNYALQRLITLSSTVLPSFTVALQDTFPVYNSSNASQINDTIFLNSTFVVPLAGISNYDVVSAQITLAPNGFIGPIVTKSITSPAGQILFTNSDLSVFTSGSQLYLRLVLKKYKKKIISGINYRFEVLSYNDFYFVAQ